MEPFKQFTLYKHNGWTTTSNTTTMTMPKKLVRPGVIKHLKEGEWETIENQEELNGLYALKVKEELAEIQASEHKDIYEFVDLIDVAFSFADVNGFTLGQISEALHKKITEKGTFGRMALNNLNPDNPSNAVYFEDEKSSFHPNTPSLTKLEEYRGTLRKAIGESTCESTRVKLIGMLQEIENQIKAIGKTLAEPA